MKQHFLTHKNRDGSNVTCSPSHSNSNPNSDCDNPKTPTARPPRDLDDASSDNSRPENMMSLKRSPPEGDLDTLPIAKRLQSKLIILPPGGNKITLS